MVNNSSSSSSSASYSLAPLPLSHSLSTTPVDPSYSLHPSMPLPLPLPVNLSAASSSYEDSFPQAFEDENTKKLKRFDSSYMNPFPFSLGGSVEKDEFGFEIPMDRPALHRNRSMSLSFADTYDGSNSSYWHQTVPSAAESEFPGPEPLQQQSSFTKLNPLLQPSISAIGRSNTNNLTLPSPFGTPMPSGSNRLWLGAWNSFEGQPTKPTQLTSAAVLPSSTPSFSSIEEFLNSEASDLSSDDSSESSSDEYIRLHSPIDDSLGPLSSPALSSAPAIGQLTLGLPPFEDLPIGRLTRFISEGTQANEYHQVARELESAAESSTRFVIERKEEPTRTAEKARDNKRKAREEEKDPAPSPFSLGEFSLASSASVASSTDSQKPKRTKLSESERDRHVKAAQKLKTGDASEANISVCVIPIWYEYTTASGEDKRFKIRLIEVINHDDQTIQLFAHGADVGGVVERKSNISRLFGKFDSPSEKLLMNVIGHKNHTVGQESNILTELGVRRFLTVNKMRGQEHYRQWLLQQLIPRLVQGNQKFYNPDIHASAGKHTELISETEWQLKEQEKLKAQL